MPYLSTLDNDNFSHFIRQDIFTGVCAAACVTNSALTVFTMDVFEDKSDNFRMWFFVVFQWGCFVLQVCLLKLHSILTIYVGSDRIEII